MSFFESGAADELQPRLSEQDMQQHMTAVQNQLSATPDIPGLRGVLPRWGAVTNSNPYIIVAFKALEADGRPEHPLNKLACKLTSVPGEVPPAGRMCHTEIMLEVQDKEWYRFSINKMTKIRQEGQEVWKKGVVHCKRVSPESMKLYHYYSIPVARDVQKRMFDFLISQQKCEFNKTGYIWNFFLPRMFAIGTRYWSTKLLTERREWFCTELVCVTMQIAGLCSGMVACAQSPNSLNRYCATLSLDGGNPVVLNMLSLQ